MDYRFTIILLILQAVSLIECDVKVFSENLIEANNLLMGSTKGIDSELKFLNRYFKKKTLLGWLSRFQSGQCGGTDKRDANYASEAVRFIDEAPDNQSKRIAPVLSEVVGPYLERCKGQIEKSLILTDEDLKGTTREKIEKVITKDCLDEYLKETISLDQPSGPTTLAEPMLLCLIKYVQIKRPFKQLTSFGLESANKAASILAPKLAPACKVYKNRLADSVHLLRDLNRISKTRTITMKDFSDKSQLDLYRFMICERLFNLAKSETFMQSVKDSLSRMHSYLNYLRRDTVAKDFELIIASHLNDRATNFGTGSD